MPDRLNWLYKGPNLKLHCVISVSFFIVLSTVLFSMGAVAGVFQSAVSEAHATIADMVVKGQVKMYYSYYGKGCKSEFEYLNRADGVRYLGIYSIDWSANTSVLDVNDAVGITGGDIKKFSKPEGELVNAQSGLLFYLSDQASASGFIKSVRLLSDLCSRTRIQFE